MPLGGTYQRNKRPVISTAPDCLVYLNGQLALPSGGNPTRSVNIQPYVTSVSVSAGIENSPGNASISLHIPRHVLDDFFRGGQLILTTMMEVRIYMKGHFLVGGAPRYYPVFWGVVTSVNHQWSGGEQTVDLACQDILYWWTIQRININPSYQGAGTATQGKFNTSGSGVFTRKNPFDVMYSLARYAYGDAVNANIFLASQQARTEPTAAENLQLMAYWTRQWGRIAYSLKMYAPNGQVLQGDLLAAALSAENRQAAFLGRSGSSRSNRGKTREPFAEAGVDLLQASAFSEIASRIGEFDLFTSEFQTKKEIADTNSQAIGYEFFMDVTGELIFKPPFYNLDVMGNKPVSWIRPIDIISESYAENVPDVTFLEGTGNVVQGLQVGAPEEAKPRATYVDYRLVQKYGWRPGSYNSEFFGAGLGSNAARNLFYHLVDELDRQNSRVHTASISIPIRPELRLGYPMYIESKDAYYYLESIDHTFSFGGTCTSNLTLMARRQKFYAAFTFWDSSLSASSKAQGSTNYGVTNQPKPSDVADPQVYATNLYSRPIDPASGNPVGDQNVILTPIAPNPEQQAEEAVETFDAEDDETAPQSAARDLVSFRTQFRIYGDFNYVYQIDPSRDVTPDQNENGQVTQGPIDQITLGKFQDKSGATRTTAVFPVSDERGYEVIGGYRYGRNIRLTNATFDYTRQGDSRSRRLVNIAPDLPDQNTNEVGFQNGQLAGPTINAGLETRSAKEIQIDPNNYGRRLFELAPRKDGVGAVAFARGVANLLGTDLKDVVNPDGIYAGSGGSQLRGATRSFARKLDSVAQWTDEIAAARAAVGVSAAQYPDSLILAFIHTESNGNAGARRTNKNGKLSQYCGLLQIGNSNAEDLGRENTDFVGNGPNDAAAAQRSIEHFLRYSEKYAYLHEYDPDRIAMVWKGGPGTTKRFNDLREGGASDSTLAGFLAERFGTDRYISNIREAQSTWSDEVKQVVEVTPEELEEVNVLGLDPEDFGDDVRASNELFKKGLEANADAGIDALPSIFQPVRDPSIVTELNAFLRNIYQKAFESEAEVEKRLRGATRPRPVQPEVFQAQPTTPSPASRDLVDSPLSRQEIRDALNAGESPTEIFGREGTWGEVREQWRSSQEGFNSAGEAIDELDLSDLNPVNNEDDQ